MSWKFVYNSDLDSFSTIEDAFNYIKETGYKFFTWNGEVYFIAFGTQYYYTGIRTTNLF